MTKEHPTVREKVAEDGVGMRWIRTAATTVIAMTSALGIVWGGFVWLVEPRFNEWATQLIEETTTDLVIESNRAADHLDRLDAVVTSLEQNVIALTAAVRQSGAPSWRFDLPTTSISDGAIGGRVTIRAGGYKLRECGIPRVDLYFINGSGAYHRFDNSSLLTDDNRGVAFPVDPDRLQSVTYTAEIPDNDGVRTGRGQGYIAVTYPDGCPTVEEVVAGPLQFQILPRGD